MPPLPPPLRALRQAGPNRRWDWEGHPDGSGCTPTAKPPGRTADDGAHERPHRRSTRLIGVKTLHLWRITLRDIAEKATRERGERRQQKASKIAYAATAEGQEVCERLIPQLTECLPKVKVKRELREAVDGLEKDELAYIALAGALDYIAGTTPEEKPEKISLASSWLWAGCCIRRCGNRTSGCPRLCKKSAAAARGCAQGWLS